MLEFAKLKDSPLFLGFDEQALKELAPHFEEKRQTSGSTLFAEDDKGDALYYIESGLVRLTKMASPEVEVIVTELGAGELFGEMALLTSAPRTTACQVVDYSKFLVLSKGRFEDLEWTAFPLYAQLVDNLTAVICRRLGAVTARVAQVLEDLDEAATQRIELEAQVSRSRDSLISLWAPAEKKD